MLPVVLHLVLLRQPDHRVEVNGTCLSHKRQKNARKILTGLRRRWDDNIKPDIQGVACNGLN
jgi:hypothetical protein